MTRRAQDRDARGKGRRAVSRRDLLKLAFLRMPTRSDATEAQAPRASREEERPVPAVVRPPGAVAPAEFAERCTACGGCADACPFDVILVADDGMPWLDPAESPCLSCLDVPCASSCETEALQPVGHPAAIRIGTARIADATCIAVQGEACSACFDACPFRHRAIRMQGAPPSPIVSPTLCTGCGVCAHLCPESAIEIRPPSPAVMPSRSAP